MAIKGFPAIDISERRLLAFDFSAEQQTGESISAAAISITSLRDADPAPATRLIGLPVLEGALVLQWFEAAVASSYHIKCVATLNPSGARLSVTGLLPVQEGA